MKESFVYAFLVLLFVVTSNWLTNALDRPRPEQQAVEDTNGQTKPYLRVRSAAAPRAVGLAARD